MTAGRSRIVPAILTDDPRNLESLVRKAELFTDFVQFDVMDGRFVPSRSIGVKDLAALPTKLDWEVHLMVERPEDYLEDFLKAGAQKAVFHFEAAPAPADVVARARSLGLAVGLAVNPETPVPAFLPIVDLVDSVLFLTVNPGYYGSPFIPEVLDKAADLRLARPGLEIGVDGGMKEGNVARVAQLGIDVIYVGSAVMLQPDPAESYRRLQALADEGSKQRPL